LSVSSGFLLRLAMLAAAATMSGSAQNYLHTNGREILDSNNRPVRITGVNWFGLETSNFAPHGLWARSMGSMLDQIRDLGYNTIRVPFSNQLFDPGSVPNGIDYSQNSDLTGLSGLQILDKLVAGARSRGLKIILDRHRPDAYGQSELWYTGAYPEARWIADWRMLATRYLGDDTVIGFDLHNEPHGPASWGDNNTATDWRLAAERAGNAILAINPRLLIIVEGIERVGSDYYWWGGNLAAAGAHPVRLNVPNQLVYSAHDYPASVYGQSWFYASNYPANLPGIWESHWAYLMTSNTAPVLLGEFGTRYQTTIDRQWLQSIANCIASRGMNFTFWSWNPNSGDTGGILQDDWRTVNADKQAILQPLLAALIGTGGGGGTGTPPPAVPGGLAATAGDRQVSLSWSSAAGAVSYNVYRGTSSNSQGTTPYRTDVIAMAFTDTGLTNGTTYYYRVTAMNQAGESGLSNEAFARPTTGSPPPAPAGVSASAGDRQATVRWSASTGASSYNLYRSTSPGGQGASPYRTGITASSFTDTGLTNGTTYFYRLSAVNALGESVRSAEVSARPSSASSGSVTVSGRVTTNTNPWWGEVNVLLSNTAPVTALTIEIAVQRTPGVTYSGQYNSYWGGMMSMSNRQTATAVVYTYVLNPGQTLPTGTGWLTAAQFSGNGTPHPASGDTYTVTATSGGVTRTLTGTF
jgi:aryl-phospho-beta-D-glucosidase BglC (GH1 family)